MAREHATIKELVRSGKKLVPTTIGPNVKNLDGWRERLIDAVGKMSYREIADRAIGPDGKSMAHTTVRSVFIGTGSVNMDTVAALCDALGIDMSRILGGKGSVPALPPPGGHLKPGSRVAVLPIVPMAQAARWKEVARKPEDYSELFYITAEGAEGLMVARVTDDSMAPLFKQGDLVTYRAKEPEAGEPAIVMLDGAGVAIMRLWKPSGDRVKLTAANEEYGSQTVARHRIEYVARVVGMARDLS